MPNKLNISLALAWQAAIGWLLALALLVLAGWRYGFIGLVMALGVLLFWLLLQFTRAMMAMKTAARNPKGYVRDAAALHRRLRLGVSLLDMTRATRSLGLPASVDGQQPEIFFWNDSSGVRLVCTFANGRLTHHELTRNEPHTPVASDPTPPPAHPFEAAP